MFSINKELFLLKQFIRPQYTVQTQFITEKMCYVKAEIKCYTQEDLQLAESRLQYKLPEPIREVYLHVSNMLVSCFTLRPLELLRWDHGYLGFFVSPNTDTIWGICKNDNPNALYEWVENIENDGENEVCKIGEELEELKRNGDDRNISDLIRRNEQCWEKNGGYPLEIRKLDAVPRWNHCLDAWCLFLTIDLICENAEIFKEDFTDTFFCCMDKVQPSLKDNIKFLFQPLSEHTELIDFCDTNYDGILMAYISKDRERLLVKSQDGLIIMISLYSLINADIEKIQNVLGISFKA